MLKLFFNRKSWIVKTLLLISGVFTLYLLFKMNWKNTSFLYQGAFFLFLFQILLALGVEKYPWYPSQSPGPGISLQFQKALVPIAYIWPFFILNIYLSSFFFLLFLNILLFPITFFSGALIYFHLKDEDPSPPNLLSGKKH